MKASPDINALVKAFGKGSVRAFDRLYVLFRPKVTRVVSAMVGEEGADLVPDICQNIFIKLWEKREIIAAGVRDFDAYLFRMTRNETLNYLERERFLHEQLGDDMPLFSPQDPEWAMDRVETGDKLRRALSIMPDRRREAFELSRLEGLSYKEIAERMGISPKTVENHISASLKEIKKNLS